MQLAGLSGVAAILRFPMPYEALEEGGEEEGGGGGGEGEGEESGVLKYV